MNIYESICRVMDDIGAVTKSKRNTQGQGFMYRGIDDVMNALNPAMVKHKVFVVPEILDQTREEKTSKAGANLTFSICKIKYTFYAEDGTSVSAIVIGEAMDSGDKATNKSMSIAFKYACFQVFCIPTEEMQDPDAETHEVNGPKAAKETQKACAKEQQPDGQSGISDQKIGQAKINTIRAELVRTGVGEAAILKRYKIEKLEDMTEGVFPRAMKALKDTKSKEVAKNE